MACGVVMLNLFQHLSFQPINLEITKQVRNDIESISAVTATPDKSGRGNLSVSPPPRYCFVAIIPRNDGGQESTEGFPCGGGLGVSPRLKKSPKIGGYRGLIETIQEIFLRLYEVTIVRSR